MAASSKCVGNRPPDIGSAGAAPQISCARGTTLGFQNPFNGRQHTVVGSPVPQKIKHHGTAPNLSDRIGNTLAGYVRRGAMDRLEQ